MHSTIPNTGPRQGALSGACFRGAHTNNRSHMVTWNFQLMSQQKTRQKNIHATLCETSM